MTNVSQLAYIGINTVDVGAWRTFAADVLGMQVVDSAANGNLFIRMDERPYRICVHPSDREGLAYFGWEVGSAPDLAEIHENLASAGVSLSVAGRDGPERESSREVVQFEDPDGIKSEISVTPTPGPEEEFRPAREMSGFRTAELGMGHVFILVNDMVATTEFYCGLLGFRVSDFIDLSLDRPGLGQAAFLRCGPRHHTLAFCEGDSAQPLRHLMVEANSIDDVGRTYDIAKGADVTVSRSIGKHTNDHMVSCYIASPSGFDIEYGWGGRVVDNEDEWSVAQYASPSIWGHHVDAQ